MTWTGYGLGWAQVRVWVSLGVPVSFKTGPRAPKTAQKLSVFDILGLVLHGKPAGTQVGYATGPGHSLSVLYAVLLVY